MNNRPYLLFTVAGAMALINLPAGAQGTYTPFNSNSAGMQDTQLRGAEDNSSSQSPSIDQQGTGSNEQSNYPSTSSNKKNKHKQNKVAKVKSDKSTIGTVTGAPTKAAKAGVGLTDKTAKASVGLTDRAAKVGVGMPAKALKETFKAIF
jgi:hypothetical protein